MTQIVPGRAAPVRLQLDRDGRDATDAVFWHHIFFAALAADPLVLDDVLTDVEHVAPMVQIAQHDVAVAEKEVFATGSWPDPRITLGASGVPLPGGAQPPMGTMFTYGVEQTFATFGRRRPARQEARARVRVERHRVRRTAWDAKADAVAMFMQIWAIDALAKVYEKQIAVLESSRAAALSQYRAGLRAGQPDMLRAEAEILAIEASLASLADERTGAVAMLNVLRGVDPNVPIDAVRMPPRTPTPRLPELLARREHTPELDAARAEKQAMVARRRLARGNYVPMIMASAQYEQRVVNMPDSLGAMISISVPLWHFDNQRRQVDVATAMIRRADRRVEAMDLMADAQIRMAYGRAESLRRRLTVLEKDAIPRMRVTVESGEAAYLTGTGSFLTVLDATLALQALEERRIEAIVALHIARFEIERILGSDTSAAQEDRP